MNLFDKVYGDEKLHPIFKSMMTGHHTGERELLVSWSEAFPDRDNKFVKEFQTTFNSSFWELYLYKLFKEMGFTFDWGMERPDFSLEHNGTQLIVEATISNNAQNEKEAWAEIDLEEEYNEYTKNMNDKNVYSIIRLSNSFFGKLSKYRSSYHKLPHVVDKPFVIAIAPYEQPLFFHQYDRAIMALLYDYYVDEEEYMQAPEKFPYGPEGKSLEYVEKDNGTIISLGVFMNDKASEISAVLFNPLATMGKVSHMKEAKQGFFRHIWYTKENTIEPTLNEVELIEDGLFVFHNPYAKHPLPRELFDKERVCQVFMDKKTQNLERSFGARHLCSRTAINLTVRDDSEKDGEGE